MVCTDTPAMLAVREFCSAPVILILSDESPDTSASDNLLRFTLGATPVGIDREWLDDQAEIQRRWSPYVGRIDLREPFTRIREAIDKARKAA